MLRRFLVSSFSLVNLPILFTVAILMRLRRNIIRKINEYKVFWGTEPLLNYHYWAEATEPLFSQSSAIIRYPSKIMSKEKAHLVLFNSKVPRPLILKVFFLIGENVNFLLSIIQVLRNASLICYSCDGFIFQHYKISGFGYRTEFYLWKLAGIKVAVWPYGSDSWVYNKVANRNWLYGLITDYPEAARNQDFIERRLKFFIRNSDLFLPGIAMFDGMGRADWITPSTLCIDTNFWSFRTKKKTSEFTVTHAPNHRAVKGTQHVIKAINSLKESGHKVSLKLIEGIDNSDVHRILATESDLHIDQLFADGYGLNALESMSLGIPTVSNFQGPARDFFDKWSFTGECPIIVSSEHELANVILHYMNNPRELQEIGKLSREYVLKHHSYASFSKNFHEVLKKCDSRYVEFIKAKSSVI